MQVFYAPEINGNVYSLDSTESRHVVRVLRMGKGDRVRLIDGRGNLYEAVIKDADQSACIIEVKEVIEGFEKRNYKLHMAVSPVKNAERFEWFIEKSVEIGVDEITPLICKNTEKPGIKSSRINNIIISAMKQSLKARKPVLHEPRIFGEFISSDVGGIRMIAHCNDGYVKCNIADIYSKNNDAVMLIGPEGDFTIDEIDLATRAGFRSVHLGKSRLRTETAGIAACHSVYFLNQ